MNAKGLFRWIVPPVLLLILFLGNLSTGSIRIPVSEITAIIFGGDGTNPVWKSIIWEFRIPKALTCLLAGSALSVSGLQMQTLFRNALAGPDVLGITSGASLAVSLIFLAFPFGVHHPWAVALAASTGAVGVFVLMLGISRNLRDNVSLLIVGLMAGAATSSIISVLQYASNAEDVQTYLIWTFGSLGALSWDELKVLLVLLIAGTGLSFALIKPLNVWFLGENYARSLGVRVQSARLGVILSACILTGGVTAFCGPLAFVGLAVPHLIKMFLRTHNHRVLIPYVMMAGAALLLFCDILTKVPGSNQILPINAVTSLIGAPIVVWVILKNKIVD